MSTHACGAAARTPWLKYLPSVAEAELLEVLREHHGQFGRPPSLRHAAVLLGVSHGAVQQWLVGLMLLGYVRREIGGGLTLVPGVPLVGDVG